MFGGYYGRPVESRYIPQGSMTFASGDTIATNSFVGDQNPFDVPTSAEETTERRSSPLYEEELDVERSTSKPKRIPKRKPSEEDDSGEDDGSSSWPFSGTRNGAPSYNAFFPIMLGGMNGYGRKSSGGSSGESYYPGSATAIANSFSTGKGGVATSHATSFGDPYLSTLFRSGFFNKKGAKPGALEN